MRTFEITAKTDGFETVLSVNEADFLEILDKLMDGFRDIVAIDEETGELMYQWYLSAEIFSPNCSPFEAVTSVFCD